MTLRISLKLVTTEEALVPTGLTISLKYIALGLVGQLSPAAAASLLYLERLLAPKLSGGCAECMLYIIIMR